MTDLLSTSASTSLDIDDLPSRAESVSPDEMQDVFGGCASEGESCTGKNTECCGGLQCVNENENIGPPTLPRFVCR